jgi:hypothetical protein
LDAFSLIVKVWAFWALKTDIVFEVILVTVVIEGRLLFFVASALFKLIAQVAAETSEVHVVYCSAERVDLTANSPPFKLHKIESFSALDALSFDLSVEQTTVGIPEHKSLLFLTLAIECNDKSEVTFITYSFLIVHNSTVFDFNYGRDDWRIDNWGNDDWRGDNGWTGMVFDELMSSLALITGTLDLDNAEVDGLDGLLIFDGLTKALVVVFDGEAWHAVDTTPIDIGGTVAPFILAGIVAPIELIGGTQVKVGLALNTYIVSHVNIFAFFSDTGHYAEIEYHHVGF